MVQWLEREDCKVAYECSSGHRDITVVLLHGYGLHRAMWEPQVAALQSEGYGVVNIDLRGHGQSRPTGAFSVRLAAEDVHALIEKERPGRHLLCGLSMGAFVTQEYALQFGGADGYMLTGVTPLCIPYPSWEKTLLAHSGGMMKYLYTWKGLKKAMTKGSATTDAARLKIAKLFDEIGKEEFLVSWQGFTTCLHEAALTFDAPLLVVAGEEDTRGTIQKHLPDWLRHYPGCEVKTLPGAGHVANLDVPEAFNALLFGFLETLEKSGGLADS